MSDAALRPPSSPVVAHAELDTRMVCCQFVQMENEIASSDKWPRGELRTRCGVRGLLIDSSPWWRCAFLLDLLIVAVYIDILLVST